jgi:hypothetical protein
MQTHRGTPALLNFSGSGYNKVTNSPKPRAHLNQPMNDSNNNRLPDLKNLYSWVGNAGQRTLTFCDSIPCTNNLKVIFLFLFFIFYFFAL